VLPALTILQRYLYMIKGLKRTAFFLDVAMVTVTVHRYTC